MRNALVFMLLVFSGLALLGGRDDGRQQVSIASWMEPPGAPASGIADIAALDESDWATGVGVENRGYTDCAVWFRIRFQLPVKGEWFLEFNNPVLDHLDVFLPAREGEWRLYNLGDKYPFVTRPVVTRNFAVPLEDFESGLKTVFVRVSSTSSVQLPTRLVEQHALEQADRRSLLLDAGLIGILSGLFLYNMLLLFRVREGLYLYYTLWLFLIGVFVFAMNGTAFQYWWPDATEWNDKVLVVALLDAILCLVAFWLRALGEFVWPQWIPSNRLVFSAMAVGSVAVYLLPYRLGIQFTILFTLACALALAALGVFAARKGTPGAAGLLMSFLPLLFGGYFLAMQRFGLVEHSLASQYAVALGCALQAIMLSAFLAERLIRVRELRAGAEEMRRANLYLEHSNSMLEASNGALREALRISESRGRAIADMKEEMRAAADERSREKSKFLAQAVHDLKQPLQAVSLALNPLHASLQFSGSEAQKELVDLVRRATGVMRTQITGLLDLSRLESGIVQPEIRVFSVASFLEQLLVPLDAAAAQKGVAMKRSRESGRALYIQSDQQLLQQILLNLIGNAIKYADPGKHPGCWVSISYACSKGRLVIRVDDNGIGIEPCHLDSRAIFQPFFQANNAHPEGEKGVGLGLSIVNAALSLLPDHSLEVESMFGVGSSFIVRVPLAETENCVLQAVADDGGNRLLEISGAFVILVEDDELVRRSIAVLLDHYGVLHRDFGSFGALQRELGDVERAPDLILTDYRLPEGKTALDVISFVTRFWGKVPAVMLTGDAAAVGALEHLAGVVGVLGKPVSPEGLLEIVAQAIRDAR